MRICLPIYISLVALSKASARYLNDYHIINGQGQGHKNYDGYDDVTQTDANDVENGCGMSPQYQHPYMCQENGKDLGSFDDDSQESRDYSKELENVEEYSIAYQTENRNRDDEQGKDGFQENGYQRVLDLIYTLGKENKKFNSNNGHKNGNQYMVTKNNGGRGYSHHRKQDSFPQHRFVKNRWHSSKSRNGNKGSNIGSEYGNEGSSMKMKTYSTDVLDNVKANDDVFSDNQSNGRENNALCSDVNQTDGIHTYDVYTDNNKNDGVENNGTYNNDNQTDGFHIEAVFNEENQADGVYNGNNQTNDQKTNGDDDNRTDGSNTYGDIGNRADRPHTSDYGDNCTDGPHTSDYGDNRTDGPHTSSYVDNQTVGPQTNGDVDNQTDGTNNDCLNNDANQTDCFQIDGAHNAENQTDVRQSDDNKQNTEQNKDEYKTNEGTRLFMNRSNKY